ncbi:hypothetical protein FOCC_FOCC016173 [Frankliniella occidentalis]|nr:hypothetical protein FOCC_FOCC016173 [Frankliniella occidentalis]
MKRNNPRPSTDFAGSGSVPAASLLSAMDRSASPCQDFFQYACGSWNKRHLIPEDRSSISTFEVLAEQLNHILKGILDEDVNVNDSNATKKAKIFYKSCMDLNQIRKVGDVPLKMVLTSLGGWPVTVPGWKPPEYPLEWVGPDDKNSSVNIPQLDQLQLALPSRDYYLKTSTETEIKAYHKYVTEVAMLMGADKATVAQEITEVINFEKRLAEASLPEADRHDTSLNYQQLPLWRLQEDVPELDWHLFLKTVLKTVISREEPVVCYGLPYFRSMGKILAETDRSGAQLLALAPRHDEYASKRVEFRRVLHGILSERPRWAQCVELTNKKLGMAVGAPFIRDNFNHESKVNLQPAFSLQLGFSFASHSAQPRAFLPVGRKRRSR